jgi:RNase P subunit RPR2
MTWPKTAEEMIAQNAKEAKCEHLRLTILGSNLYAEQNSSVSTKCQDCGREFRVVSKTNKEKNEEAESPKLG